MQHFPIPSTSGYSPLPPDSSRPPPTPLPDLGSDEDSGIESHVSHQSCTACPSFPKNKDVKKMFESVALLFPQAKGGVTCLKKKKFQITS